MDPLRLGIIPLADIDLKLMYYVPWKLIYLGSEIAAFGSYFKKGVDFRWHFTVMVDYLVVYDFYMAALRSSMI